MGTCSSCNRKECGNCLQCHNKNCKSYSPSYDPRGQCGKNVPIETKKSFDIAWELMKSDEKGDNAPTNPGLWAQAKSKARSKFKVYPSAYANGWAAKWYKSKGGGWKKKGKKGKKK